MRLGVVRMALTKVDDVEIMPQPNKEAVVTRRQRACGSAEKGLKEADDLR
jgi:hypothetical protein